MRQPARDETHLADHCNYILPETSDRLHVLLARSSPPTATKSEAQHICRLGIALHRLCRWCSVGFIYRLNDQQGHIGCREIRTRAKDVSNTDPIHVCPSWRVHSALGSSPRLPRPPRFRAAPTAWNSAPIRGTEYFFSTIEIGFSL